MANFFNNIDEILKKKYSEFVFLIENAWAIQIFFMDYIANSSWHW
jgi:hypothetical protein